jgi:DNA-binding beta-propeller fold protein YncE
MSVTVGTGRYRYRLQPSWAKLPEGQEFGVISSVAVDSRGRVYVYHRGKNPVLVFNHDRELIASWGEGVLTDAHGIFITADDRVFVVNRDRHQVLQYTKDGTLMFALGTRGRAASEAPFSHPSDVAVALTGEIFVSDGYANSRVHKFSADGRLVLSWGEPGGGPGQFRVPHGIAVDADGRVYVADRENNRVQVFTGEGEFVTQWSDFKSPMDIYIDDDQVVYVSDQIPRFSLYDRAGKLLGRARTGGEGHGICGDRNGNLYVALSDHRRQVLKYIRVDAAE